MRYEELVAVNAANPSDSDIAAQRQWIKDGTVPIEYVLSETRGSFSTAESSEDLTARVMAASSTHIASESKS
jgi:hypothetical protein